MAELALFASRVGGHRGNFAVSQRSSRKCLAPLVSRLAGILRELGKSSLQLLSRAQGGCKSLASFGAELSQAQLAVPLQKGRSLCRYVVFSVPSEQRVCQQAGTCVMLKEPQRKHS